jgi:hypothetical protein
VQCRVPTGFGGLFHLLAENDFLDLWDLANPEHGPESGPHCRETLAMKWYRSGRVIAKAAAAAPAFAGSFEPPPG